MKRSSPWLTPGLLVLAVGLVFYPALGAEFVNWDDPVLLLDHERWRGFSVTQLGWMATTFHAGHWQPLTWLSYAVDHALWGMAPRGYHGTNVVLHATSAVLVWALARSLARLGRLEIGSLAVFSATAAALFALHPLRVESVAWVTERRDVLSGALLLCAALAWLRWIDPARSVGRRWYALALVAYACSLGAKAWGITFPAVLLVLDVWPRSRWRALGVRRVLVEKIPFVVPAMAAAAVAFRAQQSAGAMDFAADFMPLQTAAQACYGLWFYLVKSALPLALNPLHLLDAAPGPTAPLQLAAFAATLAGGVLFLPVARRFPAFAAAFALYAIVISPVLGLTQSGMQLVADRYSYLATLPFALLVAAGVARHSSRPFVLPAALALVILMAIGTWRQTHVWHDSLSLWNHVLALDPQHWFALNSRGVFFEGRGENARALADYDASIRSRPEGLYAELALNNRGRLRAASGDIQGARADFDRAIELAPDYVQAHGDRAVLRSSTGDFAGAFADWSAALALDPSHELSLWNRGRAWLAQDRAAEAVGDLERLRTLRPRSAETAFALARAYRLGRQATQARSEARRALALIPPGTPLAAELLDFLARLHP